MKTSKNNIRDKDIMVTSFGTFTFVYSKELDMYNDVVLFPKKLAKANKILAKGGLPK